MSVSDGELPAEVSPPVEPSNPKLSEKKIPDIVKVELVFHTNYLKTIAGILNLFQSVINSSNTKLILELNNDLIFRYLESFQFHL